MRNKYYFETVSELSNKLHCTQNQLNDKTNQLIRIIRENK